MGGLLLSKTGAGIPKILDAPDMLEFTGPANFHILLVSDITWNLLEGRLPTLRIACFLTWFPFVARVSPPAGFQTDPMFMM